MARTPSSGDGGAGENLKSWNSEILAGWVTWEDVRFPGFQFPGVAGRREILSPTPTRRLTAATPETHPGADRESPPVSQSRRLPGVFAAAVRTPPSDHPAPHAATGKYDGIGTVKVTG